MKALSEARLKVLFRKKEIIDAEIEELSHRIVLKKIITLPNDMSTKKILEILSKVLDKNHHPLFDLVLHSCDLNNADPFVDNVFIFGRREAISIFLPSVIDSIVDGKGFRNNEMWVGFDPTEKPRIRDII